MSDPVKEGLLAALKVLLWNERLVTWLEAADPQALKQAARAVAAAEEGKQQAPEPAPEPERVLVGEASVPGPERALPDPEWVRGACPLCGGPVVSNCYYVHGKGYIIVQECWESLGEVPTCDYRRVL